jgi:hypothetical protein
MIKIKRSKGSDGKPVSDEELRAMMKSALGKLKSEAGIEDSPANSTLIKPNKAV